MHLTLILIGLLVAVLVLLIFQYNKLNRSKKKVEESWGNIEVQLNRRYELLPSLMEMVAPYAKYDKVILTKITDSRNQAISAGNVINQASAEKVLSQSLKSLFALSEDYPDLKTTEYFRNVQQELSEVEDEMQLDRRRYNTTVKENNKFVEGFPGMLIAGSLGFGKFDFFEMD